MENNYGIFYSGCASTPDKIGIINWSTNEIISQIWIKGTTDKEIRADYDKKAALLKNKYPFS